MTLTEQWKKGELENGWYYVRTPNSIEMWEYIKQAHGFGYNEREWVEEVLAPVPSYEEWKNVTNCFDYEHKTYVSMVEENQRLRKWCEEFNALDVAKENQQLKELLYKCREKLDELDYGCEVWQGELTGFIEEIDNAIGEKK